MVRHTEQAKAFEPTAHYAELRATCPFHQTTDHDPPFHVLTRFEDVVATAKQHQLWQNKFGPGVFYQDYGVLGTTDDPDHARHRRVLRPAFLPMVIDDLEPLAGRLGGALMDEWIGLGEGDFIELFAAPFPALMIAEVLGIDNDDRAEFGRWSLHAVAALTGGNLDKYQEAKTRLEDYVEAGVTERCGRLDRGEAIPDDAIGLLAVALRDGTISHVEMRYLGYQLLVAGHETTTSLLGLMLYRLIERPQAMARLRADRTLLPNAIEEALRFDSPVHGLFRTNAREVTVHGTTLPADSKVQLGYASANRDPSRFHDPDEFLIDRDRRELGRHVAFGWGIHHCIGAPLARLTARVSFGLILDRMADVQLAGDAVRNDSFVLHGLTRLPIRWTPAAPDTAS